MNKKRDSNRALHLVWFGNFGVSVVICLNISNKFITQPTCGNYAFGYAEVKNGGLWSPFVASLWTDSLIKHLCGRWSTALWDSEFLCCSGRVLLYHVANPGAAIAVPAWPPRVTGCCWCCSPRELHITLTAAGAEQNTSEKVGAGLWGVLDEEVSFYSSVSSQT